MVGGLDDGGLATPSACEGWSVADVLLHLAQTNEAAVASARDELAGASGWLWGETRPSDVDAAADAAVATERGAGGAEVRARWDRSARDMVAAFDAVDPAARVQWVVGEMAARSLATTRIAETWIHTGDIAEGLGVAPGAGRPHPPHRLPGPPDDPLRVRPGGPGAGRPGPLRGHRARQRRHLGLRRRRRPDRRDRPGRRPLPGGRPAPAGGRHRARRHRPRRRRRARPHAHLRLTFPWPARQ